MVLLPKTVPQPSQYKGPKPRSLPGPSSGVGLDGGEAAVFALDTEDQVLAGGKTEEDRNDTQAYRRDPEPADAEIVAQDPQKIPMAWIAKLAVVAGPIKNRATSEAKPRSIPTTHTTSAKCDFAASLRCVSLPEPSCLLLPNSVSLSLNPRLLLAPRFHEERDWARKALV
jgi:hypothetical protein